ncbi:hypothetical protein TNIN_353541 [Trichonephila inaurata madagascariensis]|uniref:Uncharacterized protein n=1 Tax=Trichonephila inaurata madagascariensis TaxID=2747483 RepID=A0A8X6XPZ1_9ARAC|nr:hypothetical protein TNIN_353541 [Trichonephila inaurata madagascariensis]
MAPQGRANPAIQTQTQASRESTPPQQVNNNPNSNAALITQTLQGIIQALTTLTQQISSMNLSDNEKRSTKRKDEDDFEFPPLKKTARKTVLEQSSDITLDNQYSLLPNVVNKQVSGLQA